MPSSIATITKNRAPSADAHSQHAQQPSPGIAARLAALADEHNDLDIGIAVLLEAGRCDDLLISRLKKRKLQIKDEMAAIAPRPAERQGAASCVA